MEKVRHNCGFCVAHTLHDVYSYIKSLQHRGREATGIAFIGDNSIDVIKWEGPVNRFGIEDLYKLFPSEKYHTYMAHVRYATRGRKEKILQDAHPITLGGTKENKGNHVIITDCDAVMVHNGQVQEKYFDSFDKFQITGEVDTEMLIRKYANSGEKVLLEKIPGAYSLAIASRRKREIIILRDKHGMKPAALGWKDGKYNVASEDLAFKKNGGRYIEDIKPGYAYYLHPEGNYTKKEITYNEPKHCFFEYNYIANEDSIIDGISVRRLREELGKQLTKEFGNIKADLVTFLPRCPEPAARTYAEITKIPFINVFYKTRKERSFMGSTTKERKESINKNLYLLPHIKGKKTEEYLKGKTIILIDDSTIRGNNSKHAIRLLKEKAKVKKVYFLNYTPKIGIIGKDKEPRGCLYGVDMPPQDNFIARNNNEEEINQRIGTETKFLSTENMMEAFNKLGIKKEKLCHYCIGGEKPF